MNIFDFLEGFKKDIKDNGITDIRAVSRMLKDKGFECYFVLDENLDFKLKTLIKGTERKVFTDYATLDLEEFLFEICEMNNSFFKIGLDD